MAIVGDLVANLTADVSGFVTPLRGALGMLGGLAAGFSVVGAVNAFRESEQAGKKLNAVLAATGGAAGLTSDEITTLANDLQAVTNFEGDATVAAAGVLATFTQIKGDVFKQAIVSAQDLSAVMGQDLDASIVQVGKALNDPIKGVTALQRVGVSFTQTQKDQIKQLQTSGDLVGAQAVILAELQGEFGGAAKAMADPFVIMMNFIGDIVEMFGSLLVPSINLVAELITSKIVPNSAAMAEGFAYVGQVIAEYLGDAIQFVSDAIVVVGFVIENFGSIAQLAFMEAQLAGVTFINVLGHFFTATLPGWFNWFSQNWADVFYTAFDLATTVFINLGKNIRNAMTEIWDYIASGGTDALELSWEPLTKGFVNTVKKLPEIADRIPSELEKSLLKDTTALRERLADDLGQTMLMATEDAARAVKPIMPNSNGAGDETWKPAKVFEIKSSGAAQAGSKEALSVIFASMRGSDYDQQMLDAQLEANRLAQEQIDATRDAADSEEVVEIG